MQKNTPSSQVYMEHSPGWCEMRDIDNVYSRFLVEERLQFIEVHKDFMGEMRLQVRRELKEIE